MHCFSVISVLKLLLNKCWDQLIVKISNIISSHFPLILSIFKFLSISINFGKSGQKLKNSLNSIKQLSKCSSPSCFQASLLLTSINKCWTSYKLEIVIYLALSVPSAVIFELDLTVGLAHALWHNLLTG